MGRYCPMRMLRKSMPRVECPNMKFYCTWQVQYVSDCFLLHNQCRFQSTCWSQSSVIISTRACIRGDITTYSLNVKRSNKDYQHCRDYARTRCASIAILIMHNYSFIIAPSYMTIKISVTKGVRTCQLTSVVHLQS